MMENCLLEAMRRPAWAAVRAMIGDMMIFLVFVFVTGVKYVRLGLEMELSLCDCGGRLSRDVDRMICMR